MIQQNIDIVLTQGELYPNTLVNVYRGDSNILLSVKVENQYYVGNNFVKENMTNISPYGRAIIRHAENYRDPIYCTEVLEVVDGRLPIFIPNEAIDEKREVGTYEIQIQMYNRIEDDFSRPRLTLPPFEFTVSNLISEDMELLEPAFPDNYFVGYAMADKAYILDKEQDLPPVDIDENYIETEWKTGDTIWAAQLNKIEKALSWLFNKIKSFATKKELENYATNDDIIEANDRMDNLTISMSNLNNATNDRIDGNVTEINNVKVLIADLQTQFDDYEVPSEFITEEELEEKNYVDVIDLDDSLELLRKDYYTKDEIEAKDYVNDSELNKEIIALKNSIANNYVTNSYLTTTLKFKANLTDLPTKVSQLSNDRGYITESKLNEALGDIDRILDEINGEEI